MLREKGHFRLFADYVRHFPLDESPEESALNQLKAVLWALGNIGATKNGLPFLEEEDIVKDIVSMAESSDILSLKGTCYFVLGLIAKTQQGVELLGEIGWESVVSANGEPEGLCVPLNLSRFLTVRGEIQFFLKFKSNQHLRFGIGNMKLHCLHHLNYQSQLRPIQ